ncbi:MAG: hypothetical protein ACI9V1_003537, partial [Spirosomataceae bacterium]
FMMFILTTESTESGTGFHGGKQNSVQLCDKTQRNSVV